MADRSGVTEGGAVANQTSQPHYGRGAVTFALIEYRAGILSGSCPEAGGAKATGGNETCSRRGACVKKLRSCYALKGRP